MNKRKEKEREKERRRWRRNIKENIKKKLLLVQRVIYQKELMLKFIKIFMIFGIVFKPSTFLALIFSLLFNTAFQHPRLFGSFLGSLYKLSSSIPPSFLNTTKTSSILQCFENLLQYLFCNFNGLFVEQGAIKEHKPKMFKSFFLETIRNLSFAGVSFWN